MRQIVLDTETTGLEIDDGHRVIEIGCIELNNRRITGEHFHRYINPEREVEEGALNVHGISNDFLADKPKFADIADEFIAFIRGAELIIHNAPFDVGFLQHELRLMQARSYKIKDYCKVVDTLAMARRLHPGQRNSLDALCRRYEVDNKHREWHGALLDAELLAQVYLLMTGGQTSFVLDADTPSAQQLSDTGGSKPAMVYQETPIMYANSDELDAHEQFINMMKR
ncbi:MAG: DNA polymerase III subunit epsilon [Pseudomonadota bacterium]